MNPPGTNMRDVAAALWFDVGMRPRPGEVLHFSEDPHIERFEPHVAATAQQPEAYVWAVDEHHASSYWFPRQCPRAMCWVTEGSTEHDRLRLIGHPPAIRVNAVERRWLPVIARTELYAYRFDASSFRPFAPDQRHAFVTTETVEPLGPPEPVGDLLALHAAARIELRPLDELGSFWADVITSTLGFSGIRLANADPAVDLEVLARVRAARAAEASAGDAGDSDPRG